MVGRGTRKEFVHLCFVLLLWDEQFVVEVGIILHRRLEVVDERLHNMTV